MGDSEQSENVYIMLVVGRVPSVSELFKHCMVDDLGNVGFNHPCDNMKSVGRSVG